MLGRFFDWLSNLRPRQLFLLAAASAVVIFCLMYMGLKMFANNQVAVPMMIEGDEQVQEQQVRMATVVIASRNIEPKSMILSSMLATKEVPEDQMPAEAITDIAEITNKPAKNRIMKDAIVTQQDVYKNIEQSGFVGSIPPDCRAISIDVTDVTGVAGFAKPGDYVDVLVIETDDSTVTSRLILQNVLLLSINKSMTDEGASPPPAQQNGENEEQQDAVNPATKAIENPTMATLALRPDEVLRLVSAAKVGEIYLMLRPLVPQGDYYTGAEYSVESLKGKNERIRIEKEKQEKLAEEEKLKLVSTKDAMKGKKDRNYSTSVNPENQIEIMYGNDENESTSAKSNDKDKDKDNDNDDDNNAQK